MNNLNFKKIFSALETINLSEQEKGSLRLNIINHMRAHPHSFSRTFFRYVTSGALSVLFVLGSGTIITSASQKTNPGEFLYQVKRAQENFTVRTLTDPDKKIHYSLALIEKRYDETNELITKKSFTSSTESDIAKDIQDHITLIQKQNEKIAKDNPTEAVSNNIRLAEALKTNTQVLLAVSEKAQIDNILNESGLSTPNEHPKIVLAGYENATKISLRTEQLQKITLSDTDLVTIKTAEKKYADILSKVPASDTVDVIKDIKELPVTTSVLMITEPEMVIESELTTADETPIVITEPTPITVTHEVKDDLLKTIPDLVQELKAYYQDREYNQVIITADLIEQKLITEVKIKEAEGKYNITLPVTKDTTLERILPKNTLKESSTEINILSPIE